MAGAATNLRRISKALRSLPRQWADDSATTVRKAATKTLQADTGGDASLSNAPAKLRVETKVKGDRIVTLTVSAGPKRSFGIWTWLEYGTQPHKLGGTHKDAWHPGTAAKETFTRGVDPEVRALINDARRRFGVAVKGHR